MKLSSKEQSILATFPSSTRAQAAVDELKAKGFNEVRIDRIDRFGVTNDTQYNNPINGQAETITGLTIYSSDTDHFNNNDARILIGADPSVSGMASRGYGMAGGEGFLVSMVVDKKKTEEALKILREKGGQV